jgi:magnesium chelatase subunit D
MSKCVFPFVAVLGQEQMKLALLLNVIDPLIGGVLIRGEKGTGKSTAARALAALLPPLTVRAGCVWGCDPDCPEEWCAQCRAASGRARLQRPTPFATLPLNATEEMIVGGLDFARTVQDGTRSIQPGLLARVHRGILYIDEVNLLDDHLVDVILDVAASGVNVLEREGISFSHVCRFSLVGTMNPEEGAVRPQLLDRFGLCVEVKSEPDPVMRVRLIEEREDYEASPHGFCERFAPQSDECAARIARARALVQSTRLPESVRKYIADLTLSQNVAGHRADLVIARTACAYAAWMGRMQVKVSDVVRVAEMALLHRRRDAMPPPPPSPPPPPRESEQADAPQTPPNERSSPQQAGQDGPSASAPPSNPDPGTEPGPAQEPPDQPFEIGETFKVRPFAPPEDRLTRRGSGRRTRTRTSEKQGRYVRSRISSQCRDIALDATLRAAAPYQQRRGRTVDRPLVIKKQDWREKVREKRIGSFILFVVDSSGSMGVRGRMVASKGAVMSLLLDAYQKRDRVAMVTFRRREAAVALPVTSSIEVAGKLLRELPTGGRTPLAAGLAKAREVLLPQLHRDPNLRPLVIVVTDGKANVALGSGSPVEEALQIAGRLALDARIHWTVVDTEDVRGVRFELARQLALALRGEYFGIDGLRSTDLLQIVKGQQS